jgi:penicillin-binding protein 1A
MPRQLTYMMSEPWSVGTGAARRVAGAEVAGKTGTTQAARDAWFLGFTADYVAGVWMGYDDNTPLSGVTGGGLPAEIWRQTMARIHEDLPPRPLPMIDPTSRRGRRRSSSTCRVASRSAAGDPDPVESLLMEVLGSIFGQN